MKVLAVDLETTGLDPQKHQILQIGAVMFDADDNETPVDELPYFETLVSWDPVIGSPYALHMNAKLLRRIAKDYPPSCATAIDRLYNFIFDHSETVGDVKVKPHALGFNVAAFDLAFLESHRFSVRSMVHHRPFELGSLFATKDGPASSKEAIRTYLGKDVAHDALQDARDAVALFRFWRRHRGALAERVPDTQDRGAQ